MKKSVWIVLVFIILLILHGCDKESWNSNYEYELTFSTDTLSFDTLFTGVGSTTLKFKAYNRTNEKLRIERIWLNSGIHSQYGLNINGVESNDDSDIVINPRDSIYIFVEAHLPAGDQNLPVLVRDSILFSYNGEVQGVALMAWGQDVYLVDQPVIKSQLWTGDRPYLVLNRIVVDPFQTLTLEPGARIYFHRGAGLYVKGSLIVEGETNDPVFMQGDRLEQLYENVPGQWEGVFLESESSDHNIQNLRLKNSINGISYIGQGQQFSSLIMGNSVIQNITKKGLSVSNATVEGHNLLIVSCGENTLSLAPKGYFEFSHCTFANYWRLSARWMPSVDVQGTANQGYYAHVDMGNCIISGVNERELQIPSGEIDGSLRFSYCLIEGFLGPQTSIFNNCLLDQDPGFVDVTVGDYHLLESAAGKDAGEVETGFRFPLDLEGASRIDDIAPDIGALEFISDK